GGPIAPFNDSARSIALTPDKTARSAIRAWAHPRPTCQLFREETMRLAKLQDLKGRVALVTRGSRGLGLQIAEVLGELGAKVAITARKQDELDAAAKHLNSLGIEALPLVCDMSRLETIAPMVERVISALGPIDILVNNAGTSWGAPTIEHTIEGWNKVINLNVT